MIVVLVAIHETCPLAQDPQMAFPTNTAYLKKRCYLFILLLLVSLVSRCGTSQSQESQPPPEVDKPTLALVNGYLMPMTGAEPIRKSRILISGEKIVAVGGDELPIPAGIQQIDLTGMTVIPGLIDLRSHLWVADTSADSGASDGSLQVTDSLDPFSENWQEVLRQGVTTVYLQPSSKGAMSGLGAAVSVLPTGDGSLKIHSSASGLQMSMGELRSNRERQQRYEGLKKSIQSLVDYKKSLDEYEQYLKKKNEDEEKAKAAAEKPKDSADKPNPTGKPSDASGTKPTTDAPRGEAGGPPNGRPGGFRRGPPGSGERPTPPAGPAPTPAQTSAPTSTTGDAAKPAKSDSEPAAKPPKKPEPDKTKDRLLPVLSGKIPVRLMLHNANDLRFAIQLLDEFKDIQWILEGIDDLQSAEIMVRQRRLPIVVGPWLSSGTSDLTSTKPRKAWSSLIAKHDGAIGIASFHPSPRGSAFLRDHAAAAVAHGMSRQLALESMTSTAARLLGLSDRIGSIAAGKRADIIAIVGDPIDTSAPVALVLAGGLVHHTTVAKTVATPSYDFVDQMECKALNQSLPSKYLLRSSRVLLQDGLVPATLKIENGKILSVEVETVPSPNDTSLPVVDVGNRVITPGLCSAYATLGLEDLTGTGSDSDSASMSASDFALQGTRQQRDLQQTGVFSVAFAASTSNTFSGQLSLMSTLRSGSVLDPSAAAQIVLNNTARRIDRFPSSLVGQVKLVKELLGGKVNPSRLFIPEESLDRLSLTKKGIAQQLVDGKQHAIFHVSSDAEVSAAISIIEQFQLKASLMGASEWSPFVDRMKTLGVSVIAIPSTDSDYHWYCEELVQCHSKGVPVYFGGDTAWQLRATASQCVRCGMPSSAVLHSLTQGSTMLYGSKQSMGLSAGNAANLVVWSDSPLNLAATVVALIVDGNSVDRESSRSMNPKVKP